MNFLRRVKFIRVSMRLVPRSRISNKPSIISRISKCSIHNKIFTYKTISSNNNINKYNIGNNLNFIHRQKSTNNNHNNNNNSNNTKPQIRNYSESNKYNSNLQTKHIAKNQKKIQSFILGQNRNKLSLFYSEYSKKNSILNNRCFNAISENFENGYDDESDNSDNADASIPNTNDDPIAAIRDSVRNIKPNERDETSNDTDSHVLFDLIFDEIVHKYKLENLTFPKDVMWLAGAPGSGKGEMTKFISEQIGCPNAPIMISSILRGPEIEALKKAGELVSDRIVLRILFEKLLQPQYSTGVIVDGFPRTPVQAECIKLLFDKMLFLRRKFEGTSHFDKLRRPVFHITVLYVEERVSVERQLKRGKELMENNRRCEQTGVGSLVEIRETDISPQLARERYKNFHDNMYSSLQIVKEKFPFHFINGEGTREEVKTKIISELEYQSKFELADDTFDNVRRIPLASEIKLHARHELVKRLDKYQRDKPILFNKVIDIIKSDFLELIKRQALTGQVIIRTEDDIFINEKGAIDMALDLLSERGYRVVLDYMREKIPSKVDLNNGNIIYDEKKVLVFHLSFPPPKIRHAVQQTTKWDTSIV